MCASSLSILLPANVFAQQCTNYKFDQMGVKIFDTEQGPKIVSTGQASVLIDDIDEVNDAFDEAKLNAKKEIVKFYNGDGLKEECSNGESKISTRLLSKDPDGESGSYSKTTTKEIICNTRTNTSGLVKGAVTVEQCYQKGEYVQLTLGISPKTLKQAAGLKDNIEYGVMDPNTSADTANKNRSGGLVPTEGFYYVDEDF